MFRNPLNWLQQYVVNNFQVHDPQTGRPAIYLSPMRDDTDTSNLPTLEGRGGVVGGSGQYHISTSA